MTFHIRHDITFHFVHLTKQMINIGTFTKDIGNLCQNVHHHFIKLTICINVFHYRHHKNNIEVEGGWKLEQFCFLAVSSQRKIKENTFFLNTQQWGLLGLLSSMLSTSSASRWNSTVHISPWYRHCVFAIWLLVQTI